MTPTPIDINPDTLATMLITSSYTELARDPGDFIRTYDDHFGGDPQHFAEIVVVDEFDCPDELYAIFNIADDDPRLDTLFALKGDERVYNLVAEALRAMRDLAPQLLPPPRTE
jgi:hypothetical protein